MSRKKAKNSAKTPRITSPGTKKTRKKSSSIKSKILIPILALALIIIISGVLNAANVQHIQQKSSEITSEKVPLQNTLNTAIADFGNLQRLIYSHCLADEKSYMEECEAEADKLFEEIESALSTYEQSVTDEEDKQLIKEFRDNYQVYTYTYDTAEQLSMNMMKKLAQSYVPNLMQSSADTMAAQLQEMKNRNRAMIDAILSLGEYNRFSKGIYGWVGFRTKWIPYENIERVAGETKWSFWGLFLYSLEGILAFSTAPLAVSSVIGVLLCAAALIWLLYIVAVTLLYGTPTPGFPTLACLLLLLGGSLHLSLGIMGQYLARTYLETKRRPLYIVKETEESTHGAWKADKTD